MKTKSKGAHDRQQAHAYTQFLSRWQVARSVLLPIQFNPFEPFRNDNDDMGVLLCMRLIALSQMQVQAI